MSLNTYPANPFPPSTNQMDADALETEVSQIKSGLTNYEATTNAALSVPDGSGVNLFIPSNYETFDLTGEENYRYGHSFNSGEYYVVSNNTVGIYYRIVKEDLSDLGTSVPITSTPQKVTIPSGYIMWVFSNNQSTLPNACVSKYSTAYVEYIPSVESRIEAVDFGILPNAVNYLPSVTIDVCQLWKNGKVVNGNIKFTTSETIASGNFIISGMPKISTSAANATAMGAVSFNKNGAFGGLANTSDGTYGAVFLTAELSAGAYCASFSYISA